MLEKNLSVIIPCYNCQETLTEAVESVYRQDLGRSFEIVMVNDASTDRTREVMSELAAKHPEIKLFDHPKNMGGGATRNTAVEKSKNDIIFCLDSDDMLGDGTLSKMVNFMTEKNCDAVGVSTSIKFKNKNVDDVAFTNNFGYVGEKIPVESLFSSEKCPLYSVFMFTKHAFAVAGGYPTNHGFDTQGFAWRFLANGLTAYTCPDTIYLHRVNFHQSYYIREYESGRLSHNWFKVFEEFLYLFRPEVRQRILSADLNNTYQSLPDLTDGVAGFRQDYLKFILPKTKENYEALIREEKETDPTDYYWLGAEKYNQGLYPEAITWLEKALQERLSCTEAYFKIYDAIARLSNRQYSEIAQDISRLHHYKKQGRLLPFPIRLFRKIMRETKKLIRK